MKARVKGKGKGKGKARAPDRPSPQNAKGAAPAASFSFPAWPIVAPQHSVPSASSERTRKMLPERPLRRSGLTNPMTGDQKTSLRLRNSPLDARWTGTRRNLVDPRWASTTRRRAAWAITAAMMASPAARSPPPSPRTLDVVRASAALRHRARRWHRRRRLRTNPRDGAPGLP